MSKIKDLHAMVNQIDDLMPTDADYNMAHVAYEVRKETIINKLEMLIQDTKYEVYKNTLRDVIDFIKEGEV